MVETLGSRALLDALGRGKVYDLAWALDPTMPVSPNHPGYKMSLMRRHGDQVRADGMSASNDMILIGGHTGTHIDAFCHVSQDGKLFGGVDAYAAQQGGRFKTYGMETIVPFFCTGVLLDVAGYRGVDALPAGEAVTAAELQAVATAEGVSLPAEGAVLVRTGWSKHWGSPHAYLGHDSGVPGPDDSAGQWIAAAGPRVTGCDNMAYEHLAPGAGHSLLPVHRIMLVDAGVHIIENLNLDALAASKAYEFLFVCAPLKFAGGTGSPVRPLAVVFS